SLSVKRGLTQSSHLLLPFRVRTGRGDAATSDAAGSVAAREQFSSAVPIQLIDGAKRKLVLPQTLRGIKNRTKEL
ncbi:hypothetical protein ACCS96_34240, partial [Rhizobium ruizarguesonis]